MTLAAITHPADNPYPEGSICEDIEQAFLGALLVRDSAYDDVSWMQGYYFYVPVHGRIYDCIKKLKESGKSVPPDIVAQFFEHDADLQHIGGIKYLKQIAENVISTMNARHYAENIYLAHLRRAIMLLGQDLKDLAAIPSLDMLPSDLLARAEKFVYEAMETPPDADVRAVGADIDAVIAEAKNPTKGIPTGFRYADSKMRGFIAGNLYVLAGRPGMGKTAMALTLAVNAACNGEPVLFFSLEMSHEQVVQRILSRYSGEAVHSNDVDDWDAVEKVRDQVAQLPLHIDATATLTVSDIASRVRRHKRMYGIKMAVVDYLGLIMPANDAAQKVHQIEQITQGLKRLAKETGIPIILLSQLSRKVEERDDKRPILSDLRDSGSIEQDADVVMFVYRDEYYLQREKPGDDKYAGKAKKAEAEVDYQAKLDAAAGKADLIIAKLRQGKLGTVRINFDGKRQVFHD